MLDNSGSANPRSPEELVEAVATRRDKAAFKQLFEYFAPRIKTLLMRGGAAAELAEDIAQEALVTVWRKADYFDSTRASASAWIYTIARNIRIDRARRDKRAKLHMLYVQLETEAPEKTDAPLDATEREHRVRAAMCQLSDDQMRVVQLSFFESQSHGEIATRLGIPLGTVKSRLRLAMMRLREGLGDLL